MLINKNCYTCVSWREEVQIIHNSGMVSSSKYETDELVYEVEIEGTCVSIQFSS